MGQSIDQFIRSQNIERYRRLLERATEETDREKLLSLLTEEQQKQKEVGDDGRVSPQFRLSDRGGKL